MTTENTENTTSQVSHAGDSTTQHNGQRPGVGSSVWLGDFLGPLSLAVVVVSGCFTGYFTWKRVQIEKAADAAYYAEFERMRTQLEELSQWRLQQSENSRTSKAFQMTPKTSE